MDDVGRSATPGQARHQQPPVVDIASPALVIGWHKEGPYVRPRPSVDIELELFAAVTMAMLEEERVDRTVIESVRGDDLCFRHLDETRAWQDFRFRGGDWPRLFAALRFPAC